MNSKKLPPKLPSSNASQNEKLEEKDFYFNEQGYLVFTEHYHLKRGYCCGNKCIHCPYPLKSKN